MNDRQDINSIGRPSGRRSSDRVVGASPAMQIAIEKAGAAARSNAPVVVLGAPGSGRGHLARAIHAWSARASGPLEVFSAIGTPDELHTRELFGSTSEGESPHENGTGALERAARGSLLIEGLEALSDTAGRLLSETLRCGFFKRLGEEDPIEFGARLIATSSDDGAGPLSDHEPHCVSIACLAERQEDVLPLAAHFLASHAAENGHDLVGFTADARRWLVEEVWTGNVRELSERVRQAVALSGSGAISAEALMLSTDGDDVPSFKEAKRAFETRYVEGLLRRCNGNISRAARLAKKDRKDFYDVIRRTGVDPGQFRP